jgi:hypothetical protein
MSPELQTEAVVNVRKTGTGAQDAVKDLESVGTKADFLSGQLKNLGGYIAGYFGAAALGSFVKSSIASFADAEAAVNKLNGSLRARGQHTEQYSRELQSLAGALQDITTYGDDAIVGLEQQLISAGASRNQIDRLTRSTLDLASGLGVDLSSAAHMVGRAVAGETASFTRLGFQIDQSASSGQQLEQVLAQIQLRFGGLAANEVNTLTGATKQLANAWDDLKESIGGAIAAAGGVAAIQGATRVLQGKQPTTAMQRISDNNAQGGDLMEELDRRLADQSLAPSERRRLQLASQRLNTAADTYRTNRGNGINDAATQLQFEIGRVRALLGRNPGFGEAGTPPPTSSLPQIPSMNMIGMDGSPVPVGGGQGGNDPMGGFGDDWQSITGQVHAREEANREEVERTAELQRSTGEAMRQFEAELTIEAIGKTETRTAAAEREYKARIEYYDGLKGIGRLTEEELTRLTEEASQERRRIIAEEKKAQDVLTAGFIQIGRAAAQQVAGGLSHAFVSIINGTESAGAAFKKFAANVLSSIAEMIIQLLIMAALKRAFGGVLGLAGGGVAMAASGGVFMAANGGAFPGVASVDQPTYFPKFNVIAGEAGREMLTVLARPSITSFGGVPAVVGNMGGNRMALMPASAAAGRANAPAEPGGTVHVVIDLNPGLRAEIVEQSAAASVTLVTRDLNQDSAISRRVKAVAQNG